MQQFGRRLSGKLDLRRPLHFLIDFDLADQVGVSIAHSCSISIELIQRVVKIVRQDVAFFIVLIEILHQLCFWDLGQMFFNCPHQGFGHQQRNIVLERIIHRRVLHSAEQRLQTLERATVL